jgi:hypothetical protein
LDSEEAPAMPLPRMTTRRWMVLAAAVALDCAGLFCGPDWLMILCAILTASAPVVGYIL